MPDILTVAELDRRGSPYVGPAMLGKERVMVYPDRIDDEMPWTEALVTRPRLGRFSDATWQNTALLRAVEP